MSSGMQQYTGSLAAAQDAVTVPMDGVESVCFQTATTIVGTVIFEGSNDGVTWFPVPVYGSTSGYQAGGAFANPPVQLYYVAAGAALKAVRMRLSAYTSGGPQTVIANADDTDIGALVPAAIVNNVITSGAGAVSTSQTGAATKHALVSAASTNATSAKVTAGNLYAIHVVNDGATKAFLKLYDKATAPNPASDTPIRRILLPPNSMQSFTYNELNRLNFGSGLAYVIVGLAADTDATAVAAAQVLLDLQYG